MKNIIKLVGKYNTLELGYVEDQVYHKTDLLADEDHNWKILQWINNELEAGYPIQVVKQPEGMMAESQRKNKKVLDKIVASAFRNSPD